MRFKRRSGWSAAMLLVVSGTLSVTASLVGYWKFDEGSGASVADGSGPGISVCCSTRTATSHGRCTTAIRALLPRQAAALSRRQETPALPSAGGCGSSLQHPGPRAALRG